jgi:hypothetical protein
LPGWRSIADQDLAALLAALATRPGQCRLLITSRYPFALSGHAERALSFQQIGPLSAAETMKLAWALPALDKLTEAELQRVWQMVGGHPRCLEYLDALLSGGRSTYPDVTARLAANLASHSDIPDLDEWFEAHGTLEPALAETLTWPPTKCSSTSCWPGWPRCPEPKNCCSACRCTGHRPTKPECCSRSAHPIPPPRLSRTTPPQPSRSKPSSPMFCDRQV